ncbi:MAG TPA: hypothetical protein EYP10_14770 [Armatimonadetes bacterium]|nr:hypothetical protein [Armatimonadota bacterium]
MDVKSLRGCSTFISITPHWKLTLPNNLKIHNTTVNSIRQKFTHVKQGFAPDKLAIRAMARQHLPTLHKRKTRPVTMQRCEEGHHKLTDELDFHDGGEHFNSHPLKFIMPRELANAIEGIVR